MYLQSTKQARKAYQSFAFLLVIKGHTNELYIFQQFTYIVYI